MTMLTMNIRRRPSMSVSQPPSSAPNTAPACTAAAVKPSISGDGLNCCLMKTSTKAIE